MLSKKAVFLLAIFSISALGCASGLRISIDTTGMGESEVSKVLVETLWGSEEKIKERLSKLVNGNNVARGEPREFLKSLGFRCDNATMSICTYHGEVKGKLVMPNETTLPENNRIEVIDVVVSIDRRPFVVDFKQKSKINKN